MNKKIKDISVTYETVCFYDKYCGGKPSHQTDVEDANDLDLNFLPIVIEAKIGQEVPSRLSDENVISEDETAVDVTSINVKAPSSEQPEDYLDWSIFNADWDDVTKEDRQHSPQKDTESENPELNINTTLNLPKPIFESNEMLELMQVLSNMALLGDHREIPFLKSLLPGQDNPKIITEIKRLINKFGGEREEESYFLVDTCAPEKSVFSELMEKADIECKLLLIDEMAAVGDEKEVLLLQELASHQNGPVKNHAQQALEQLSLKFEFNIFGLEKHSAFPTPKKGLQKPSWMELSFAPELNTSQANTSKASPFGSWLRSLRINYNSY